MINFNFKEFFHSKVFSGFIFGLATFLVLTIVFQIGVFVGFKKAHFSQKLGENYGRIFGEEKRPKGQEEFFDMPFDNLPGGHGAVGAIIKVSTSTLVVAEPNNLEKIIRLGEKTIIRKAREEISGAGINVGDFVSIIGEANDQGEIEAKFIRVLPPPPVKSIEKAIK